MFACISNNTGTFDKVSEFSKGRTMTIRTKSKWYLATEIQPTCRGLQRKIRLLWVYKSMSICHVVPRILKGKQINTHWQMSAAHWHRPGSVSTNVFVISLSSSACHFLGTFGLKRLHLYLINTVSASSASTALAGRFIQGPDERRRKLSLQRLVTGAKGVIPGCEMMQIWQRDEQ